MKIKLLTSFLLILVILSNTFSQTDKKQFCGTRDPNPAEVTAVHLLLNEYKKTDRFRQLSSRTTPINIPVYVHILRSDDGTQGNVQLKDIEATIQTLNTAFQDMFTFTLMNVHNIDNTRWFMSWFLTPEVELESRQALHVGGRSTLNIYSANLANFGYGGYGYFPWEIYPSSQGVLDGITLKYNNFSHPIGRPAITPHEVGHWLGLMHTFEGECSAINDYVADTPAEKSPGACVEDTCPTMPGTDLIDNYMGYRSAIPCAAPTANVFTAGQKANILAMFGMLRDESALPPFSVRMYPLVNTFNLFPVYVTGVRYQSELVEFEVAGLPENAAYTLPSVRCRANNCTSIFHLIVFGTIPAGDYLLTITATSKRGSATTQTVLKVE